MYSFVTFWIRLLVRIVHRASIHGMDQVPKTGAALVVGNHKSNVDPFYMGSFVPRKVHFMAKRSLFRFPLMKRLLESLGAFPVDREKSDIQSIKTSLSILGQGGVVGLFPEGGRNDEELTQVKHGAAYLAVKMNCPIIPIHITGSDQVMPKGSRWIRPAKIQLHVGKVLYPSTNGRSKERQLQLSEEVLQELKLLQQSND